MKVWIVRAETESGDDYGPFVFAKKPSDERLKEFFREKFPSEFDDNDGPGDWRSFIFIYGPIEESVVIE